MALDEPYASIEILPEYPFGWYGNAGQIESIFNENKIQVVIEVGSWLGGGSTRHIAELLKKNQGTLYAVDTWLGSPEQQPGQDAYQPILSQAYEQFLSNMIHWNLAHLVIPCRMTSVQGGQHLKAVRPDLIYIDGEHSAEAVYQDLVTWYPFVKDHGILCGDDWDASPDVQIAVRLFAYENKLGIDASGNFWRLRP